MEASSFLKLILPYLENKKTGALKIKKDQLEKTLFLKEGGIIYVDSSLRYENLGRLLVDTGRITEDQFSELLNKIKETGKRQGEALVELGFLTPFEVFEALKDQLVKKISNCFLLQNFDYEFLEGPQHVENVTEIPINVLRTLLDGVQTICTHDFLKEEGGFTKDMIPVVNQALRDKLNSIRLKPEEVKLLRLFDGKKTLFEIVRDSGIEHQFILSTVYFLNAIGVIEYRTKEAEETASQKGFRSARKDIEDESGQETPKSAKKREAPVAEPVKPEPREEETPPEQKDNPLYGLYLKLDKLGYLELFSLSVKFKKENLKKNYEDLIRRHNLDRIDETYKGQAKETAEKLLNKVVTAFTVLRNEKKKDEYLKARAKIIEAKPIEGDNLLLAEIEMNKAMMYKRKNNFAKTLEHLRKANELNPNEIDYMVSIAEIQMNLHGKEKKPQIPDEVLALLKKASSIDENNINVLLNMGIYYKLTGERQKAVGCFNKVLSITPENPRANAELRLFNIRGEKKPIFSMFAKKPKKEEKKASEDSES